ncbi:MAG: DUF362 domain-containing protein [Candidatus Omnitrophica bacterium]|nr:DUF362 domain-containing protein [Candidatus Omnitrophota bacterium]MDD5670167.1 DUF362 domain-containing protein [Candidatus Omnitrophota bacterium]
MEKLFYWLETFLTKQVSRGKFLKLCFGGLLFFLSQNQFLKLAFAKSVEMPGRVPKGIKGKYDLVVAEGNDPYQNTVKAIESMGGMGLFVRKDALVVIKPNMAWDRTPAQAANTDPNVVAALVDLAYKAGAKRVNIFDVPCNDQQRVYERSGIAEAAKAKGAYVYFADHWNVVKAKFPYKSSMSGWPILRDAVVCDTFINVPVLKHHSLAGMTLSMKNLMGICSGQRGLMHIGIGKKLVDITDYISPELTVIDATRVLTKNGPSGGSLKDVISLNKIIVATDSTLADTYACSLMNKDPMEVPNIKEAVGRGFGSADLTKANLFTIQV